MWWVSNFPFEALGLSNKYEIAPASVSEFGFTYDGRIVKKFGGFVWPGVRKAEEDFGRRIEQSNISPTEMRRAGGDPSAYTAAQPTSSSPPSSCCRRLP